MKLLYFFSQDYCTEDDCVKAAARVTRFIDKNVSPCDNFYEYACGKWMKDSLIPDDKPEVTVYTQVEENVKVILKSK